MSNPNLKPGDLVNVEMLHDIHGHYHVRGHFVKYMDKPSIIGDCIVRCEHNGDIDEVPSGNVEAINGRV